MEKKEFDAVEMTRRIRDEISEVLKDLSPEERVRFVRERAGRLHERVGQPLAGSHPTAEEAGQPQGGTLDGP